MKKSVLLVILILVSQNLLWSQESTIRGVVRSAVDKESLPGVTVVIQGTVQGTITDIDGRFTISASPTDRLRVSFIGFRTQVIEVGARTDFEILLEPSVEQLDEVVVVGFGVQRKESVVGAITQVGSKDILESGVPNIANAITGKLSGVVTIQNSGKPGSNPEIMIRGKSTWAGSAPLFMVDGVERSFTEINPNDIASISVLKDASATAIYGTKGANGVFLITTLRGQVGKPVMNFSYNFGAKTPTAYPTYYDSYKTLTAANEAMKNDNNWSNLYSQQELQHYKDQDLPYKYPSVDWFNELVKTGVTQNANFNVRGGTERLKYFGSFGYLHDGDIINTQKQGFYDPRFYYDRFNVRSNLDFKVTNTTDFSVNFGGSSQITNEPAYSQFAFWNVMLVGPVNLSPPYYGTDATDLYPDPFDPYSGIRYVLSDPQNPYTQIYAGSTTPGGETTIGGFSKTNISDVFSDVILKQNLSSILSGLSASAKLSYNSTMGFAKNYRQSLPVYRLNQDNTWTRSPNYDQDMDPLRFQSESVSANIRKLYYEALINYANTFRDDHSVTLMGVFNRTQINRGAQEPFKDESWASRATYDFRQKYLLEANIGYRGSEQFAPANRFGFFPAFAVGYNIHEENFFKSNMPFLSTLKTRFSYGKTGSDAGARWLYYSTWNRLGFTDTRDAVYGANGFWWTPPHSYKEGEQGNLRAQWEVAIKKNLGFEIAILQNKFSLILDLFDEKRDNILMIPRVIPTWVQVDFKALNIGKTKNQGYELELNYREAFSSDLYVFAKGNYSFSQNRIEFQDDPLGLPDHQRSAGKPIGYNLNYISTSGYFASVDDINNYVLPGGANPVPGDVKFIDYNADGMIDVNDQVVTGYTDYPLSNYAISFGGTYKRISLSLMIQGQQGKSSMFKRGAAYPFENSYNRVLDGQWDYWTPDNPNATHPALHYNEAIRNTNNFIGGNNGVSSLMWLNTSFIRLKQMEVNYSIESERLKNRGINNLLVYINGNNLLTFSRLHFGDPEQKQNDPGAANSYPLIRYINAGFRFSF